VTSTPGRPGPTVLRIRAVRWLAAELIPFGFLAIGVLIFWRWWPGATLGFLIAVIAGVPLTVLFLYKVLGAAVAWIWPIVLVTLASTSFNAAAIHAAVSPPKTGTKVVVTSTWWLVGCGLAIVLAIIVALAAGSGERWLRRNRAGLPRNKFEAFARSRGTMARLWLPQ
jgi:hypothetical protein